MSFLLGIIFGATVIGTIFTVKNFALAQPAKPKGEDFPIVMNRSLMPTNRGTLEIVDTTNLPAYSKEDTSSVFPTIVSKTQVIHDEGVELIIEDERNNNEEQSLESIFAMYGQTNEPVTTSTNEESTKVVEPAVEPVAEPQQVITEEEKPKRQYVEAQLDETTEAFVNFLLEGLPTVEEQPETDKEQPLMMDEQQMALYDELAAAYEYGEENNGMDYVFEKEQTNMPIVEEQIQPQMVTTEESQPVEPSNLETGVMTVNTHVEPEQNELNIFGDVEEEQNNDDELVFANTPVLASETISAAPVVVPFIISSIPNPTEKKKEVVATMTKEEKFLNDVNHELLNVSPIEQELINNSVEDEKMEEVEPVVLSLDDLYDPNNLDARFMRIAEYFADVCENTLSEGIHGFKTFVVQVVGTESECIHVTDGTGRIWFDVEAFQEKEFQRGDILLIEANFGEVVTCSKLSNVELEREKFETNSNESYSLAL